MNCSDTITSGKTENLVFLNKVFYDNTGFSCPVIYPLVTDTTNYTQKLSIGGTAAGCGGHSSCGCGCSCGCSGSCDFDLCNAQFTVTNSCVTITSAVLSDTAVFTAGNVTVDGLPATDLSLENGRYYADLSGIMTEITRCPGIPADKRICSAPGTCDKCNSHCSNNGHFFLAEVTGPWEFLFNITIDGYVSNGRCTRDFRLCLSTLSDAAVQVPVTVTASNNFALQCIDIPCQSQGIAPSLRFNFEACGMLLKPVLTIAPSETPATGCPAPTQLILTANMVITPSINLQVVRPSLFALNAQEVGTCCDDLGQCNDCLPDSGCGCGCHDHHGCNCHDTHEPGCCDHHECGCTCGSGGSRPQPITDSFACQCNGTNGFRF